MGSSCIGIHLLPSLLCELVGQEAAWGLYDDTHGNEVILVFELVLQLFFINIFYSCT